MVIVFVFGTVYFMKTYSLRKNLCFQYFKQIGFGRAARPTFSKQDPPTPPIAVSLLDRLRRISIFVTPHERFLVTDKKNTEPTGILLIFSL